ncbi:MAG: hypothetical protein H7338_05185 [Candidatus Sericytochromatia bacterium]|nr:hypothetical protein [Candidatus Sericytochromatia bacterium]
MILGLLTQAATITLTNENMPKAPGRPTSPAAVRTSPDAMAPAWLAAINRLRSRKGLTPVVWDPAIGEGARRQAEMITRLATGTAKTLPSRLMLDKLWEVGAYDGNPVWRVISQDAASPQGPGANFQLGNTLEGDITHVGVASAVRNGQRWTVLSAARRRVNLSGFHLGTYKPFERLWLRGKLMPGCDTPRLVLTRPNGRVSEVALPVTGELFDYMLELDETKGRYMIEIMVDGRWGPAVASLFPVDVGGAYQAPAAAADSSGDDSRLTLVQQRDRMLMLINADRKRFTLAPVRLSERMTVMAQGHSADMKQHGFFAHVSPVTGDLGARAKAASLPLMSLGENIAVAGSLVEAQEGLMGSPAHRGMILDPQMTVVGIGIVFANQSGRDAAKFWVTQNYGEHDPEQMRQP